jgi:hypothetical protein
MFRVKQFPRCYQGLQQPRRSIADQSQLRSRHAPYRPLLVMLHLSASDLLYCSCLRQDAAVEAALQLLLQRSAQACMP